MENKLHSYPSVYAIGHGAIPNLFDGPVVVHEKVDGSQFSFGLIDGELVCRSKSAQINMDAPEGMFVRAVETVKQLAPVLHPSWVYRCEYLNKPHHNVLTYARVPENNLIVYDINTGLEEYLFAIDVKREAVQLGLETVPLLYIGAITSMNS